ncbi:MAG: rhodanese-like domain-containing protein [Candidatus Acidiferrum sp.]
MALLLRRQGIKHIRPLQGGLEAWREAGYPVAHVKLTQITINSQATISGQATINKK